MKLLVIVQTLFLLVLASPTWAQFVSSADQDLTVKSVSAVPFTDNLNGIYAKPLFAKFTQVLAEDKQWTYQSFPDSYKVGLDLDEKPEDTKKAMAAAKVDGLFTLRITKGPKGLNGQLLFFVGKTGYPLLQEEIRDYQGFETADLEKEIVSMYNKIKSRLPYRGTLLSRRGQDVTVNLGTKDGLRAGTEITVIQILKVNRHPKLHFLISTEKEIIGKVKIHKVDDYLSFGYITLEKEPNAIQVGGKILTQDFIQYAAPITDSNGKAISDLQNRSDKDVSYGSNPQEWLPENPPQYGRIGILAGFGMYSQSTNLSSGGVQEAKTSMAPEIAIKGEFWITSEWAVLYNIRQSVFSVSNPLSGSSPGTLNMSLSSYGVSGAYNFLLSNDFLGPKIQVSLGYATYKSRADQSTPLVFTNMDYGGLVAGFAGQFPLSEMPVELGAKMNLFLNPSLSESTASGDTSRNTVNEFGFFGIYSVRTKFKIRGEINFEYYSSDFSGGTVRASSTTQKMTSFLAGVEYLF